MPDRCWLAGVVSRAADTDIDALFSKPRLATWPHAASTGCVRSPRGAWLTWRERAGGLPEFFEECWVEFSDVCRFEYLPENGKRADADAHGFGVDGDFDDSVVHHRIRRDILLGAFTASFVAFVAHGAVNDWDRCCQDDEVLGEVVLMDEVDEDVAFSRAACE